MLSDRVRESSGLDGCSLQNGDGDVEDEDIVLRHQHSTSVYLA